MPDETTIWGRAQSGDPESFGAIFDQHRDRVYGQALRLMRTTHDAEDVTALVFLEAWRRRGSVRLVDGSVLAWLLVATNYVARNAARTTRRHRIAMAKLPPQDHEADPSDSVLERLDGSERAERVRAAFARLTKADQNVLTLCVINEFPLAQAAEALGVPLGTVKSRLSRAKQRLAAFTEHRTLDDASTAAIGDLK